MPRAARSRSRIRRSAPGPTSSGFRAGCRSSTCTGRSPRWRDSCGGSRPSRASSSSTGVGSGYPTGSRWRACRRSRPGRTTSARCWTTSASGGRRCSARDSGARSRSSSRPRIRSGRRRSFSTRRAPRAACGPTTIPGARRRRSTRRGSCAGPAPGARRSSPPSGSRGWRPRRQATSGSWSGRLACSAPPAARPRLGL